MVPNSERMPLTDEELAELGMTREEYDAFDLMADELGDGSDDPQPGDPDFNPSVPPYVVCIAATDDLPERRFLHDPANGGVGHTEGLGRVYSLDVGDVVRLANLGFNARQEYVRTLDLDRLTLVEESHGKPANNPYQLPLITD